MAEAGIMVTSQNKKQVDEAIHQMMKVNYKDCPATWKALKQQLGSEAARQDFMKKLQMAMNP